MDERSEESHTGGRNGHDGVSAGGVWDRQGGRGAVHPSRIAAQGRSVHRDQLRRVARATPRIGAVRLRAGCLYRRPAVEGRPDRIGIEWRAVPRRNQRDEPVRPGEVLASVAGARVPPTRWHPTDQRKRARDRGDEPSPAQSRGAGGVSRRPVLPLARVRDRDSTIAGSDERRAAARRCLLAGHCPFVRSSRRRSHGGRETTHCSSMDGQGTSASCATRSNALPFCRKAA